MEFPLSHYIRNSMKAYSWFVSIVKIWGERCDCPTATAVGLAACSVLQCVAVCCSALQCVAVRCSALQCVAVCCSVLQCVAVCCSVLQCVASKSAQWFSDSDRHWISCMIKCV